MGKLKIPTDTPAPEGIDCEAALHPAQGDDPETAMQNDFSAATAPAGQPREIDFNSALIQKRRGRPRKIQQPPAGPSSYSNIEYIIRVI